MSIKKVSKEQPTDFKFDNEYSPEEVIKNKKSYTAKFLSEKI